MKTTILRCDLCTGIIPEGALVVHIMIGEHVHENLDEVGLGGAVASIAPAADVCDDCAKKPLDLDMLRTKAKVESARRFSVIRARQARLFGDGGTESQ